MIFRTMGAPAVLLIGSMAWGDLTSAQDYPPPSVFQEQRASQPRVPGVYNDMLRLTIVRSCKAGRFRRPALLARSLSPPCLRRTYPTAGEPQSMATT